MAKIAVAKQNQEPKKERHLSVVETLEVQVAPKRTADPANSERDTFIREYLRALEPEEYRDWISIYRSHLEQRREPLTNGFDLRTRSFRKGDVYIAIKDIGEFPTLTGAHALDAVIIPKGIKAPRHTGHMPYGHTTVVFDHTPVWGKPPIYTDLLA